MWDGRLFEIRALRPRLIRLFVQEYFDVMPDRGRYRFDTLDRAVDVILKAGAKPLLCIVLKPKLLFPVLDNDKVEPVSWKEWEALIFNVVRHYKERGGKGWYWEVTNEGDIPSGGGTPYHFTPENYPPFYQHTVSAILRADPDARVGGPALARWNSPILPALLRFCESQHVPLHFVSWHGYSNDPMFFRDSIRSVKTELAKTPGLHPETVINEWNMSLREPVADPRFQPAFIAETTYQMKEEGLDLSCYYHIRDFHPIPQEDAKYLMPANLIRHELAWNRRASYQGLFDFQNRVRPAYFLMKAMARLTGDRLRAESPSANIHVLAADDEAWKTTTALVWNFSKSPAKANLEIANARPDSTIRVFVLDAVAASDDDSVRLRPLAPARITGQSGSSSLEFEPYGVLLVSVEARL